MGDPVLAALERDEAYSIVRVLGESPTGTTELVRSEAQDGLFVRKRIPHKIANREAWAALAGIHDRRIPEVVETYELPDSFTVIYRYVDGIALDSLMEGLGLMEAAQALSILEGVCGAADTLHAHGIVHRDITPANVVVENGLAHLIDLGIARVGDASAAKDTTHLGTWGFASPEQYGFAQTDARSDVYSIGCLAAFLLTGLTPDADGFDEALAKLDPKVLAVIQKARSFEPSKRYSSAGEFYEAFETAAGMKPRRVMTVYSAEPQEPIVQEGTKRKGFLIRPHELFERWQGSVPGAQAGSILVVALLLTGFARVTLEKINQLPAGDSFAWRVFSIGYLALMVLLSVFIVFEALFAWWKVGPYKTAENRILMYVKRVLIGIGAAILVALVFHFVGIAAFGKPPELPA